jgi:transposase
MRRKGTNEPLAEVRARGLALLAEGQKPKEVAELLGGTRRSINRWEQDARHPKKKKKAARPPGRPRKWSEKQTKPLEKALDKGAYAFGYAGAYWTLDRIAQMIWQLFRVRDDTSSVWQVMQRLGWSSQRPQRQAVYRDEASLADWQEEELPRIKKVSPVGRYPRSGG